MSAEAVLFGAFAAVSVAGAVGVVASRQPVHSAISLLVLLLGLAVTYLLLGAQFVAALQVIIYAGAIVVLFLFVIMLLNVRSGEGTSRTLPGLRPAAAAAGAVLLFALSRAIVVGVGAGRAALPRDYGTAEAVGRALFTDFLLPFEAASIVLVVGIVAAVVIARGGPPTRRTAGAQTELDAAQRAGRTAPRGPA